MPLTSEHWQNEPRDQVGRWTASGGGDPLLTNADGSRHALEDRVAGTIDRAAAHLHPALHQALAAHRDTMSALVRAWGPTEGLSDRQFREHYLAPGTSPEAARAFRNAANQILNAPGGDHLHKPAATLATAVATVGARDLPGTLMDAAARAQQPKPPSTITPLIRVSGVAPMPVLPGGPLPLPLIIPPIAPPGSKKARHGGTAKPSDTVIDYMRHLAECGKDPTCPSTALLFAYLLPEMYMKRRQNFQAHPPEPAIVPGAPLDQPRNPRDHVLAHPPAESLPANPGLDHPPLAPDRHVEVFPTAPDTDQGNIVESHESPPYPPGPLSDPTFDLWGRRAHDSMAKAHQEWYKTEGRKLEAEVKADPSRRRVAPSESFIWRNLKPSSAPGVKTNGEGLFFGYDHGGHNRHNAELEVWNKSGKHLGAIDPITGRLTKGRNPRNDRKKFSEVVAPGTKVT
jgi:hypothetical protein